MGGRGPEPAGPVVEICRHCGWPTIRVHHHLTGATTRLDTAPDPKDEELSLVADLTNGLWAQIPPEGVSFPFFRFELTFFKEHRCAS